MEPRSPKSKVLSLDLATHLGYCFGDVLVGHPISGHYVLPSTKEDIGPFAAAYDAWLRGRLGEWKPDRVVIEQPMPTGGGKTPIATSIKLQGLCYHTELVCHELNVRCRQIGAATWKKSFTGSGKACKSMKPYPVIVACHERGFNRVTDDNEADAIGIWYHAASFLAPKAALRFDPLGRVGLTA